MTNNKAQQSAEKTAEQQQILRDLLITSELLYQLSHSSTLHICCNRQYFTIFLRCCQGRISCKRGSFCRVFHKKLLHFSPAAL